MWRHPKIRKEKEPGKSSKKTRTVADIRDQSMADKEKQKQLDKKVHRRAGGR